MPKIWPFEFWLLVGASWLKTQKYNRYGPNWAVSGHGCLAQHCPTLHGPVDMPDHAGPGSLAHFSSLLGANICLGKLTISPQRFSLCYVFRSAVWCLPPAILSEKNLFRNQSIEIGLVCETLNYQAFRFWHFKVIHKSKLILRKKKKKTSIEIFLVNRTLGQLLVKLASDWYNVCPKKINIGWNTK